MRGLALGDPGRDPPGTELVAVRLRVVAAVADQCLWAAARAAAFAANGRDRLEQRQQLGHVVAVGGAQQTAERNAASVGDQMVLGAGFAPIDRAWTGFAAPKTART